MSYDISLLDPVTKETIQLGFNHVITGGTYQMGGSQEAWLNVTYNYSPHFKRVFGENGIRSIYEKSGAESIAMLEAAIEQLGDDVDDNYWAATEGNAKKSLHGLLAFARLRPDGIWSGD